MRVLIDTNVLISAALSANGTPYQAYVKAASYPNRGLICEQNVDEMRRIFNKKFPSKLAALDKFLSVALLTLELVPVPTEEDRTEAQIRDVNDRPILRAAIEAGADVLAGDHAGGGVAVAVDVLVVANGKTGVDDAVDLSVGGEGGAGGEGAGHGAAEDGMLHISSGVLRAGSARRPCPVVVLRKVEDDGGGPPEDCSLSCGPGGIRGEMPFSMRALSVRGIRPWRACGPRFGQRSPCGRRPCRWRGSGTRWRSSRRCRCR